MAKILKSGIIHTEDDLVTLNMIDFGRQNGHPFGGPHKAIHAAFGCASCLTYYCSGGSHWISTPTWMAELGACRKPCVFGADVLECILFLM